MPEYLAPGVYVEETSFRPKSIEGVSTTTTGLIGPARYGPLDLQPEFINSLREFEHTYGDGQQLNFSESPGMHNYLWHAVRAFFEEGGKRCYISRVFLAKSVSDDGRASAEVSAGRSNDAITISARFPGEAGNMRVRFDLLVGKNILGTDENGDASVAALIDRDVVWLSNIAGPISSQLNGGHLYVASFDQENQTWSFRSSSIPTGDIELGQLNPTGGDSVRIVTISVTAIPNDPNGLPETWPKLPLDPDHEQSGTPDSLSAKFAAFPTDLAQARSLPIVIALGSGITSGPELLAALFGLEQQNLADPDSPLFVEVALTGGNDGQRPTATEYDGVEKPERTGLKIFEDIDDISIVAAPGSTFGYENGYGANANTIINLLIEHAERMRYRIAVLDSGSGQSISQVRSLRAKFDSSYAALITRGCVSSILLRRLKFICRQVDSWPASMRAPTSIAGSTKHQLTKW